MRATKISRRRLMYGVAGVGAVTILHWPANAAEFTYKFDASSPMEHPAMARTKIAADRIRQASNGRLDISYKTFCGGPLREQADERGEGARSM